MGIPQLFDVIKDHEEVVHIAQLAEDHHRQYGRPLRIAVDEADWRFNNLTQAQVYAIRDTSDMAYQGQEKAMFYRICRFLTLNIQLIFVFDGPSRPWKHGRRGQGKIDYRERDLLKEMLRCFGIPYHEAPGEAEAECARLKILGLVDAVWSQDSDCLMFGCTLWIRDDRIIKQGTRDRSKENTQKSKKTVRVVRAQRLKAELKLDREALVLFAMLVGGDYDATGLRGCGPSMAKQAIRRGLGQSLLLLTDIDVPTGFPDFKTLVKYNSPKVTADNILKGNARLDLNHPRPINELKLLEVTSSRFNIWGRLYMNWVGPVLLVKSLTNNESPLAPQLISSIKLVKQKAVKDSGASTAPVLERKLSFSPFGVTSLKREDFEGFRLGYWNGDRTTLFDPAYRVEKCEIPNYWLQKVLPQDVLDPPPSVVKARAKKRTQEAEAPLEPDEVAGTRKKPRTTTKGTIEDRQSLHTATTARSYQTPRKQQLAKVNSGSNQDIIEISDSEEELGVPSSRLPARFAAKSVVSQIFDLGSPSSSEDASDAIRQTEPEGMESTQIPFRYGREQLFSPIDTQELDDEWNFQKAMRQSTHEHTTKRPGPNGPSTSIILNQDLLTGKHPSRSNSTLVSDRSADSNACLASSDILLPDTTALDRLHSSSVSPTPSGLAKIRAARIRHFQSSSAGHTANDGRSVTTPLMMTHRSRPDLSHFDVPADTDCIDLTED
ncbi:hypothetical protein ACEQ8H_002145 [Pleosporales sp. CAS-2024a]